MKHRSWSLTLTVAACVTMTWMFGEAGMVSGPTTAGESTTTYPSVTPDGAAADGIHPYSGNPYYWQYNGEPLLLLGGSNQDNLFNHPDLPPDGLEAHLDLLVSAGGNYIRNTLSSRDQDNLWPFQQREPGWYDLDHWNEAYWQRLESLLQMSHERGIIVQIELWDPWDLYSDEWTGNPWNPDNNINYSTENTTLAAVYNPPHYSGGTSSGVPQDFFLTVPGLANDTLVLSYQTRFVDRLLSHTLPYDHILYCITNEIHPHYSPEWGWYWSDFIKKRAADADRRVHVTEMFWQPDFQADDHKASFDYPEIYDHFEASQNSANLDPEAHWESLVFIRERLRQHPRPIHHTKIYGADTGPVWAGSTQNSVEKFWRNLFAGSASSRFHRIPAGIGLTETAQNNLKSARLLSDSLNVFNSLPLNDMLSGRSANEAYAFGEPGVGYAVYFPGAGSVGLSTDPGMYQLAWLDIDNSRWLETEQVRSQSVLTLDSPGPGNRLVWIRSAGHP